MKAALKDLNTEKAKYFLVPTVLGKGSGSYCKEKQMEKSLRMIENIEGRGREGNTKGKGKKIKEKGKQKKVKKKKKGKRKREKEKRQTSDKEVMPI